MTYQSALTALSDSTRREIFEHISRAPLPVGELARALPVSRPAVSQHLKVLSDAGLVTVETKGTRRIYSASPDGLAALRSYLDGLWEDALRAYAKSFSEETND